MPQSVRLACESANSKLSASLCGSQKGPDTKKKKGRLLASLFLLADHFLSLGHVTAARNRLPSTLVWGPSRGPPLILSLCDYTGAWSQPYVDAGYEVIRVDLAHGQDVRLSVPPSRPVRGVLAAPPCTVFANSGARWPRTDDEMREGLSVVDACLRLVIATRPKWWALENPVGKLRRYLGPPSLIFQPNDYGDPYTKRTCLWGEFTAPEKTPVAVTEYSKMGLLPPSPDRAAMRSVTPAGFARAFFEANS